MAFAYAQSGSSTTTVADARDIAGLRWLVYRDGLAKHVIVTDDYLGLRVVKINVLAILADRGAGENFVVLTESDFVFNSRANADFSAGTDFYIGPDIRKRVYNDVVGEVGGVFDNRRGMDFEHALDLRRKAGGHAFFG